MEINNNVAPATRVDSGYEHLSWKNPAKSNNQDVVGTVSDLAGPDLCLDHHDPEDIDPIVRDPEPTIHKIIRVRCIVL